MTGDFSHYARLAEDTLYNAHTEDDDRERTALARGHAWATLALAAAVHELAEAQANT